MRLLVFLAAFAAGLSAALPALAQANVFANDVVMCSGRPWIDVRCNGATGDGIHDDTAAINTTIAAAITGNFPMHMPAGTYKVTSKITIDYQGIAGNGFNLISRGATIDGRTIASGNVLQIQCSGGTTGSPATCNHLIIENDIYVLGSTPAYVVALGKTDFSDIHNAAKIDHLVVTNASANAGAGAIQANYLIGGDLWLSGTTAGGNTSTAAVAFEQVQQSRIGGAAVSTASAGANAAALLFENGSTIDNLIAGFTFSANTCLSLTSATAIKNTFIAPLFPCAVAINGTTSANNNTLIGPTYSGPTPGPLSGGISTIGRGSLNRYIEPTASSLSVYGVDDGTIVSAKNATGSVVNYNGTLSSAASLPVTLPAPSQVGPNWTMAFVTDSSKAVVLTAPTGKILAGGLQLSTLTVGPGNSEVAVIASDGANFRLLYSTTNTKQLNGIDSAHYPSNWVFPPGPGYGAVQGDNGSVFSSKLTSAGLTITLPSTTAVMAGWTIGVVSDNKAATINVNGTAGGSIVNRAGFLVSTYSLALPYGTVVLQFDGTNFRSMTTPVSGVGVEPLQPPLIIRSNPVTATPRVGGTYGMLLADTSTPELAVGSFPVDSSGISTVVTATTGSTANNINGVAAYVHNRSASSGIFGPNAVAFLGEVVSEVDNADSWGTNLVMYDQPGITGANLQNEFDCNVGNPTTKCYGLVSGGFSTVTPLNSAGVTVASLSIQSPGLAKWTAAFWSQDAASDIGLLLGTSAVPTSNVPSQIIAFQYNDVTATKQNISVGALGSGYLGVTSNVAATGAGMAIYNNFSGATNTSAQLVFNAFSGSATIANTQVTPSASQFQITGGSSLYGIAIAGGCGASCASFTGGGGLIGGAFGAVNIFNPVYLISIPLTPGGKQPVCIDEATGRLYGGTAGAC